MRIIRNRDGIKTNYEGELVQFGYRRIGASFVEFATMRMKDGGVEFEVEFNIMEQNLIAEAKNLPAKED